MELTIVGSTIFNFFCIFPAFRLHIPLKYCNFAYSIILLTMKHQTYACIVALLLCTLSPMKAAVFSGGCGPNNNDNSVQWSLDDQTGVLQITGNGPMNDYTYDTRAPWNPYRDNIHKVIFSETVTRSGNYAFYDHTVIDSVYFGGVQTVGKYGYHYCNNLHHVRIPHAVGIEEWAFESCHELRSFVSGNQLQHVDYRSFATGGGHLRLVHLGNAIERIEAEAFLDQHDLDSLYLGNQLRYIKEYAFRNSVNLHHVVFPATLEDIEYYAFESSGLLDIHIPINVRNVSETAFHYCGQVLSITVDPANQTFDSRMGCNAICRTSDNTLVRGCQNSVIPNDISTLGTYAFSGCGGLTSISIPNSVTDMGSWVFENCGLISVNFPNSIISCGAAPFNNCHGLTTPIYNNSIFAFLPYDYNGAYTFPAGLTQIVSYACENRNQLTQAFIPDGYTRVGGWAFQYCVLLDTASIGEGITNLEDGTFYSCSSLRDVHLPYSLNRISYHSFSQCHSLQRILIPDAVNVIGTEAFRDCSSLQYVSIPAAIEYFESWWGTPTFMGCTSLRHVNWNARTLQDPETASHSPFYDIRAQITQFDLGDSVSYVPNYLCYEMSSLQSIRIGENVRKIGTPRSLDTLSTVFYGCRSVSSITWNARNVVSPLIYDFSPFYSFRQSVRSFTFGDSVRVIPSDLCYGMNQLTKLRIPKNVFHIGNYAFRMANGLDTIMVDAANQYFDSRNSCNAIIRKDDRTLILGCGRTVIPATVTSIGDCAFRDVVNLTTLTIPASVNSIGKEAFSGCTNLSSISLPQGITEVADYAFQNCYSLTNASLPQGLKRVGIRSFSSCEALPVITMPASLLSIDKEAFDKTIMSGITMLATVPPTIELTSLPDACPISIPCAAIAAYQNAPVWDALGSRLSAQYPFSITVSPNNTLWGSTSVQRTDCDEVVLSAVPAYGFHFVEWQNTRGERISETNPYTFNLAANTSLIAFFQAGTTSAPARISVQNRTIEIQAEESTTWKLIDLQGKPVDYAEGESVSLTAPSGGIYILQSAGETHKIMIR